MPDSITAEAFVPTSSGSGSIGVSSLPWGAGYFVTIYKNGEEVAVLASPAFTGTPTAPTPATASSSTVLANTAFVQNVFATVGTSVTQIGAGTTLVTAADLREHLDDATIHLTIEQIRDSIATAIQDSNSIDFTHNDGADTYTFDVRLKSSSLAAAEGTITAGTDGLVVTLGTAANTACAGNDSRLPTSTEKAGFRKHNFSASVDPGADDDTTAGYEVGSRWTNTAESPKRVFECVSASTGAAEWERLNTTIAATDLDSQLDSMLVDSNSVDVLHNTADDEFSFAVRRKASGFVSTEGAIAETSDGIVVTLGSAANTSCAGNDERLPVANVTAGLRLNNFTAGSAPTATDDAGDGYGVGSLWVYSGTSWICSVATAGSAVWKDTTTAGDTLPVVDETALVYRTGSASVTLSFDASALTTARTWTAPDVSLNFTPTSGSFLGATGGTGFAVQTGTATVAARTLTTSGTTGISVTNGNGVAGNPTIEGVYQHSITAAAGSGNLQLVNDADSPGNSKLYGTNSSGTKGWYDQPTAGTGSSSTAGTVTAYHEQASAIGAVGGFWAAYPTSAGTGLLTVNDESSLAPAIGLAYGQWSIGGSGTVYLPGLHTGLDTSSLSETLYYGQSSTTSPISSTRPSADSVLQPIAYCLISHASNGVLFIFSNMERQKASTWENNLQVGGQAWSATHALTSGTSVAVDCNNANSFSLALAHNATLAAPTNLKNGATYTFKVTQTGSFTLSYNSAYKFPGGSAPTLTTGSGSVDVLACISDGTNLYCNLLADFS